MQIQHTEMTNEYQGMSLQDSIQLCLNCHAVCLQTIQYCEKAGLHGTSGRMDNPDLLRLLDVSAEISQCCANVMLMESPFHRQLCSVCADACTQCAQLCDQFGQDAQLGACATACRECANSCRRLAA